MGSPAYGLSINIYGRGDAKLGDGPSHMGIAIYKYGLLNLRNAPYTQPRR